MLENVRRHTDFYRYGSRLAEANSEKLIEALKAKGIAVSLSVTGAGRTSYYIKNGDKPGGVGGVGVLIVGIRGALPLPIRDGLHPVAAVEGRGRGVA